MCSSCATGWGACGCEGGTYLAVCACTKGLECPACGHYPNKSFEGNPSEVLKEIMKPHLFTKDLEAYNKDSQKDE